MKKTPPMYKRNKGKCSSCGNQIGPFVVMHFGNFQVYLCHACLTKAILTVEEPPPTKKKVPDVSEIPENSMASVQRGLADAKEGKVSPVEL